jgi:hypothetical protein
MMSVITIVFVLAIISAIVLYVSGKEIALSRLRLMGAQSMNIAEGGAYASRSALMAFMNADPVGVTTVDASLTGTMLNNWYAAGTVANQNAFAMFDYLVLDGQRFTLAATPATDAVTFHINWALATPRRKLQVAAGTPPANALGDGTYQGTVVITRRLAPHPTDAAQPNRYIQQLGVDMYEYYYTYTLTADGQVPASARRRVTLSRDFSVVIQRQTFAQYALFTHVHTTPSGGAIWFTNRGNFDGPVHTNGEFRFAFFPKFGTPDPDAGPAPPCGAYDPVTNPNGIQATQLTSVSTYAWYNNNGSPVRIQANENVVSGVRRDAAVLPDCTVSTITDDNDNPPANFTRGAAAIPYPTNSWNQAGVAIGRDPADATSVTNLQIRQAIPELADDTSAVPNGIYVPRNGAGAGSQMAGGIYIQGDLTSFTLSVSGPTNNLATYTLVRSGQTVTITIDRDAQTTTVTDTTWAAPQTRAFTGVPRGWHCGSPGNPGASCPGNENSAIFYVNGTVSSFSGTLEEKEQTTVVATGRIDITNHVRYEVPPDVTNPASNPTNVLGLYSSGNDIRITTSAPNDLDLHAVLMAGNTGDATNSSVNVQNYNSGSPRGYVNLIGGLIEEYYGAFGTFNADGSPATGYGRNFRYDRRMSRGFTPPFFPTTNLFMLTPANLAGARPVWREASP